MFCLYATLTYPIIYLVSLIDNEWNEVSTVKQITSLLFVKTVEKINEVPRLLRFRREQISVCTERNENSIAKTRQRRENSKGWLVLAGFLPVQQVRKSCTLSDEDEEKWNTGAFQVVSGLDLVSLLFYRVDSKKEKRFVSFKLWNELTKSFCYHNKRYCGADFLKWNIENCTMVKGRRGANARCPCFRNPYLFETIQQHTSE